MRNFFRHPYVRLLVSGLIAVAVTAAILRTQRPATEYRTVVVVTRDIEPNTELTSANLALKPVPASLVPSAALTAIPQGKRAAQKLWQGQVLLAGMVTDDPLPQHTPDQRIVALPVTLASAGGLQPGDRVDVIATTDPKRAAGTAESRLIVAGVPVVRVLNQHGQPVTSSTSSAAGSAAVPAVAEVLVSAADVPRLAAAVETGTISVARYLPNSQPVPVPTVSLNPVVTTP